MTLIQSWIDSLQLLKPKNLQLFVLVTLKSILEAYKLMFKYFWWLIALQLICYQFVFSAPYIFVIATAAIQNLLFFMLCAVTRPSVVKKDCAYFRSQLYPYAYIIGFLTLMVGIGSLLGVVISQEMQLLPVFVWTVFYMLFFLDSEKSIKSFCMSLWYALKMMLFNLPLIMIIYIAFYFFNATITWGCDKLFDGLFQGLIMLAKEATWMRPVARFITHYGIFITLQHGLIPLLLLPIGICTYANIYIKKLHDQFDLYVKQPQ